MYNFFARLNHATAKFDLETNGYPAFIEFYCGFIGVNAAFVIDVITKIGFSIFKIIVEILFYLSILILEDDFVFFSGEAPLPLLPLTVRPWIE